MFLLGLSFFSRITMAHCVISAKYPPLIDLTRTPLAYGDRAIPRLDREIRDENLLTRQRAVRALCDYLIDPEHVAEACRYGVVETLRLLLKDSDVTVRSKATEALCTIASYSVGRQTWADAAVVKAVADLWDDSEPIVRKNAHIAIKVYCEGADGATDVVASHLVKALIEKLKIELDEIKISILDSLHFSMMLKPEESLEFGGLPAFAELLGHKNVEITLRAARNIMDICSPLAGKEQAIKLEIMQKLVDLIVQSDESRIRGFCAGAVAMIAITTKGKYTALRCSALDPLVDLVSDPSSEARALALKAITCISEAPEGRAYLQQHVDRIRQRVTDPIPNVSKAAQICVNVITWKP